VVGYLGAARQLLRDYWWFIKIKNIKESIIMLAEVAEAMFAGVLLQVYGSFPLFLLPRILLSHWL